MDGPVALVERTAARTLVIDAQDRLLLLQGVDPARPDRGTWWFTPGGGLVDGESPAQGARRELFEETGLLLDVEQLGDPVWHRTAVFDFDGTRYRQSEQFFLVRVERHDVVTDGFDDLERRAVHDHRWWSLADLATTADRVYPSVLAVEVTRLLRDGRPAEPIEVAP